MFIHSRATPFCLDFNECTCILEWLLLLCFFQKTQLAMRASEILMAMVSWMILTIARMLST